MRYLVRFKYDGNNFHGFQRQNDVKNVQGTLESVLSKYYGEDIVIKGSGRTDAGVHALDQCAHFDTSKKIDKKDKFNLNKLLNNEIVIKKMNLVSDSFHARHDVKKKTYIYKIYNGSPSKEYDGYYYQVKSKLDYKGMKKACKVFIGTHDFRNFVSGPRDDYTTTIFSIKMKKCGNFITITFVGIGFYRYMVRHLVGALISVGKGKSSALVLENMLLNPSLSKNLGVAPAEGLYLKKINF